MPRGSSAKRERQYEHIKASGKNRGMSEGRAEEIAARTVNKERARSGESKTASRSSTEGKSASQRGGEKSGNRSKEPTRDELYQEAKNRGIEGRSSMSKKELAKALGRS
ncbi:MAG TPA: plasmid stabilization protein [Yinghuangia sp.]|uniref:plasmid stabilization protein n=1 Tax=Yinghuangia sp. YIM S10712 TaxID=3436930 RepID=UPI002C553B15|nr:plasmid stabilization protein [Yinghuangia sp.]